MPTNYSSDESSGSDSESSICEIPDSQDVKKRAKLIIECPKLLNHTFFLNEEGCPMHFIILHRDSVERTRLQKLLYEHMASYSENLDKITPYTAVLVADDCRTWSHDRDVFKISYIHESIEAGVILDISKFLKSRSQEFIQGFDFMKIVYYRKYTWDNVPTKFKLQNETSNSDLDEISVTISPDRSVKKCPKFEKKTRCAYSTREKQAILQFIIASKRYKEVKGNKLWRDMEEANVCPIRTWQSMKEHFLKKITRELSSYRNLTPDQRSQFKRYIAKDTSR